MHLMQKICSVCHYAGSTNYENSLTMGWLYSQPITVQMLLANRSEEEYFGVKISLEFG